MYGAVGTKGDSMTSSRKRRLFRNLDEAIGHQGGKVQFWLGKTVAREIDLVGTMPFHSQQISIPRATNMDPSYIIKMSFVI